jgi:hypothetical protein
VTETFTRALIAELGKKTGVCWLRYAGQEHAVWHAWVDDALHLVCGGDEQPLPGIEDATTVEVTMRSKDNGGRLVTWVGEVATLAPGDEAWEPVTAALVSGRLNLDRLPGTAERWAAESLVVRVTPTGAVLGQPGELPDSSHVAPPRPSPATTRGPLPRVLHRRQRHRPGLT